MTWREVGAAATDAERAAERAILAMPGWAGRAVRYMPVPGGLSNSNWRVRVAGSVGDCFMKIPGRGTEMFVDRAAAVEGSRRAAEAGCGPPVVSFLPELGVEVSRFVEGRRTATNSDFARPSVRRNAIDSLRRFHQAPPLRLTKTLFDMIDEHLGQIRTLGAYSPPDFAWMLRQYRSARLALEAAGLDLVPCMNDTLAGNFLLDAQDGVLLVDFEFASNNDRACELGAWFVGMSFPREVEHELLEHYFGRVDPRTEARVTLYKALADLKWASWAMVQQRISLLDFDYHKYGVWKHMRARSLMHHPDWAEWLRLAGGI